MSQALSQKGSKIIGTRWVLSNKNDALDPDVRARLVAQEINVFNDESAYAATPPLESKRLLLSQWAAEKTRNGAPLNLSVIDVKEGVLLREALEEAIRQACTRALPPQSSALSWSVSWTSVAGSGRRRAPRLHWAVLWPYTPQSPCRHQDPITAGCFAS